MRLVHPEQPPCRAAAGSPPGGRAARGVPTGAAAWVPGAPRALPDQTAPMRAPLCLLLLVAHAMDMLALNRRKKQVGTGLGGNCTGCVICSEENGCSTCQQRLFLFIRREGIRQYGKCVHDCPPGYFGVRGQEVNRCRKCGATCESCFSQDFCIRCERQFYLYKGKCLPTCPLGTVAHQSTRECQEECELGPWGSWSPCRHNGKTCGSAWGVETRVREPIQTGREEATTCQVLSESRKCPIQRHCPEERNPSQKKGRKDRRPRKDRKLDRKLDGRPHQPPA